MLGTANRLEKLDQLKANLVSFYGSCLLKSLDNQRALEVLKKTDTPDQREAKIETNKAIIAEREEMYAEGQDEMLAELEKLMGRIEATKGAQIEGTGIDAPTTMHAYGSHLHCTECGNKDREKFYTDPLDGDVICLGPDGTGCGTVVVDHEIFSGAEKRNFEGEADRNHFGPKPNKLLPDVVNMETSLMTLVNGRESSAFRRVAQASTNMELGLSTLGREDRHTRTGYKVQKKRQAFRLLEEIGGNLNLHYAITSRAKEIFSRFRDDKEAMHNFEGSVLACIVLAYEELSLQQSLDLPTLSTKLTPSFLPTVQHIVLPRASSKEPSIATVPMVPLGKFTVEQVGEWLLAVGGTAGEAGLKAAKHLLSIVQQVLDAHAPDGKASHRADRVNGLREGIFGTVTISQRVKRLEKPTLTNSAGRHLVKVNLQQALKALETPDEVVGVFKDALLRRCQYDKALADQEAAIESEKKRLHSETSQPSKRSRTEGSLAPVAMEMVDMDLEELIGGSITVIPSAPSAASSAAVSQEEEEPTPAEAPVVVPVAAPVVSVVVPVPVVPVVKEEQKKKVSKPRPKIVFA